MAKRKRAAPQVEPSSSNGTSTNKKPKSATRNTTATASSSVSIQIIAGSYDRILHGMIATIPSTDDVEFADSFIFNAHASAIKCLAVSPPSAPVPRQTQKVILASGSTDQRINLYHLSAHPPRASQTVRLPSLNNRPTVENSQNKELGSLLHHSSTVSGLYFPTRSKLLSSAEDSTIAVTRTRDWSLISTIKAPIPKPQGRPSGDTAPLGGTPAGVNDFAVHPSMKLMISVGKGERCMRLWNLVTGKKAGVLNFGREMLSEVGEGRFGSGEGRKVSWGATAAGDEFCVGFDKGILVFGMDSKPRCRVVADNKTKFHSLYYVSLSEEEEKSILAVSTEDGRLLFFSTAPENLESSEATEKSAGLPSAKLLAQLGGKETGLSGRTKDFKLLKVGTDSFLAITAGSDGTVRIWRFSGSGISVQKDGKPKQIGKLIGTCETGNRITCLEAFVLLAIPDDAKDVVDVEVSDDEDVPDDSSSDSE